MSLSQCRNYGAISLGANCFTNLMGVPSRHEKLHFDLSPLELSQWTCVYDSCSAYGLLCYKAFAQRSRKSLGSSTISIYIMSRNWGSAACATERKSYDHLCFEACERSSMDTCAWPSLARGNSIVNTYEVGSHHAKVIDHVVSLPRYLMSLLPPPPLIMFISSTNMDTSATSIFT